MFSRDVLIRQMLKHLPVSRMRNPFPAPNMRRVDHRDLGCCSDCADGQADESRLNLGPIDLFAHWSFAGSQPRVPRRIVSPLCCDTRAPRFCAVRQNPPKFCALCKSFRSEFGCAGLTAVVTWIHASSAVDADTFGPWCPSRRNGICTPPDLAFSLLSQSRGRLARSWSSLFSRGPKFVGYVLPPRREELAPHRSRLREFRCKGAHQPAVPFAGFKEPRTGEHVPLQPVEQPRIDFGPYGFHHVTTQAISRG
jgi:hypothetical protein